MGIPVFKWGCIDAHIKMVIPKLKWGSLKSDPCFNMGIPVLKWVSCLDHFNMETDESLTHFKMGIILIWEIEFSSPF